MITTERAVTEALSGVHRQCGDDRGAQAGRGRSGRQRQEVQPRREEIDLDRLTTESEDTPVIKIENLIIVQAMKEKAPTFTSNRFEKL